MVDLAGSEKCHAYQFGSFTDERIQELVSINKSLSNLGNCVRLLANGKSYIPYRDSKLTRLLADSLGGNSKTLFIITLSPSIEFMDDGISSLQFAERAKSIEINVNVNETNNSNELIKGYEMEIARLKDILEEKNSHNLNTSNSVIEENKQLKEENEILKKHINSLLYICHGHEPILDDNNGIKDFSDTIKIEKEKLNIYLNSLSHYPVYIIIIIYSLIVY